MTDFEKQIEEQVTCYQMQLQDNIKHLCWLMKSLGIDTKEKLDTTLEFAELFLRLKSEGVIKTLS